VDGVGRGESGTALPPSIVWRVDLSETFRTQTVSIVDIISSSVVSSMSSPSFIPSSVVVMPSSVVVIISPVVVSSLPPRSTISVHPARAATPRVVAPVTNRRRVVSSDISFVPWTYH